jgi:predicted PolB exonuclease-like 3'-5' exonuclease
MHYRSLVHGVVAERYWDCGDGSYHDSRDFKWNNYINRYHARHLDLMDVLAMYQPRANAPLDQLAKLMGYPGKLGMDGSQVWNAYCAGRIAEVRDYCETDVVNTWLVYLRFQLMRGCIDRAEHDHEVELVRASLNRLDRPHWREFLAEWTAPTAAPAR